MKAIIGNKKYSIKTDTFSSEDEIEQRSTCSFSIVDKYNEYDFKKGLPSRIINYNNDAEEVFSGYLENSDKHRISYPNAYMHDITLIDMHYLADKRRISYAARNKLAGDIIKDIVDLKLVEEGVWYDVDFLLTQTVDLNHTLNLTDEISLSQTMSDFLEYLYGITGTLFSIEDGRIIIETRANFVSTEQLISSVAEKVNFWWKIDSNKMLSFKARDSNPADWELTPSDIRETPTVKTGNPLYRNQQIVKGPVGITGEQTDIVRGDGDTKAFPVSFPIAKEPTIEVSLAGGAWTGKTVEKKGNAGAEWYWEPESDIITQDNTGTRLTSADRVRCTFIGQFKLVALTYDSQLISKQADIDGTSGIVEDAIDVGNVEGSEAAIEIGNAKIAKYGVDSKQLSFQTMRNGLQAGQLITVNDLAGTGIDDGEKLLITGVTKFDEQGLIFNSVQAVKGPKHRTWEELFTELSNRASLVVNQNIGETEILVIPLDFSKTWTFAENPNIFRRLVADGTYAADGIYTPNFRPQDRVTHIAWYNGTTELGRQEVSRTDVNTDNEVETLSYLGPNSANADITHFAWVGGHKSTEEIGTGVLVDKQVYDIIKEETESLQITKNDYSWNF